MSDWLELAKSGRYAEAEADMLADTDRGEGFFPLNEVRASFYENWGDDTVGNEKVAKYKEALMNWEIFASCSTSGGEGTARMMDVKRVLKKINDLEGK